MTKEHVSKTELISLVVHELRTPVAMIKEAVMLLSDGTGGSVNNKQKVILNNALENIERMNRTIDQLLDVTKIDNKKLQLAYTLVNFNHLLEHTAGFFKRSAEEKRIDILYILPKTQVNIFVDSEAVHHIISNLINNSIKFTHPGGSIKVELAVLETKIRVGIIDTGIGIDGKGLSLLFNKFVQVSSVPEMQSKGVGIGLFITKELVEKHGGEIWAESEPRKGSKFYFTLPRFYTTSFLKESIKEKINDFLRRGESIYLINVHILRYKEFKKRINIEPKRLFGDMRTIIEKTLIQYKCKDDKNPQIAFSDYTTAEYSILFPGAKEEDASKTTELLKKNLETYFFKHRAKDIFINLGILSYLPEEKPKTSQQLLANLHLKKVLIGANVRLHERINYKSRIEVIHPKEKTEYSQTIDVSEGGVCFITDEPLKTDSYININLKLPSVKKTIQTKGRVAWIKNMKEGAPGGTSARYKAGLEFVNLSRDDKKAVSDFVKAIQK